MAEDYVQRKLTTILAADVEGYTRLMSADEEATLRTLKSYREIIDSLIAKHDGRLVGTAGDAVLVEFTSAVEAARCARSIQEDLAIRNADLADDRRTRFRIGINVGDVMVEGDNLFGDGVNVAARLESMAEPGGICISRSVRDLIRDKLDFSLRDLGEIEVKNLPRPVRAFRVLVSEEDGAKEHREPKIRSWSWRWPAAAAILAIGGLAAVIAWLQPWVPAPETAGVSDQAVSLTDARPAGTAPLALPDGPSIAVLPFNNMSSDQEQEYFSDGITEDIITDLSKISNLFVVARNSTFAYKGKTVDVRTVARELGVSHVLEGSVRKAGGRVRITAQLLDAKTGNHLWAERYDREMTGIFAVQDEVTRKIVLVLAVKLTSDDEERMTRSAKTSPEAYDMLLRGLAQLRRFTPATVARSRQYFLKAIEQDAQYARAYANVAYTHGLDVFFGVSEAPDKDLATGLKFAQQALALNPRIPQTHFALSFVYWQQRRAAEAIQAAHDILRVAPNYADGRVLLASTLAYVGRHEEALDTIGTAMRLNTRYSFFYVSLVGRIRFALGQYQAAIVAFRQVLERNSAFLPARRGLAASYALIGKSGDAEWEAQEILTLQPGFTLRRERRRVIF